MLLSSSVWPTPSVTVASVVLIAPDAEGAASAGNSSAISGLEEVARGKEESLGDQTIDSSGCSWNPDNVELLEQIWGGCGKDRAAEVLDLGEGSKEGSE